jgi:hypothetical protein
MLSFIPSTIRRYRNQRHWTLENVSGVGSYRAADAALCLVLLTAHSEQTWESVMIDRNTKFVNEAKIPLGRTT